MKITILNSTIGTPRHLVHDGVNFTWVTSIPDGSWVYPGDKCHRSLSAITSAVGGRISGFDDTPSGKAWSSMISGRDIRIPWFHALPADQFQRYLSDILDQLWMVIKTEHDSYYMNEFVTNRELLESLCQPLIDAAKIENFLADATDKSRSDLTRFLPDETSRAPVTSYTQNNTVTGRLTVTGGPNILTLKRKYRDIMRSEFTDGVIIQADIVSLEPRIALCVAQKTPPEDIYDTIRDDVLDRGVSRSHAKIATLGCIYGMSPWTLSKRLPDNLDARDILMKIRDYFDIPHLERDLKRKFNKDGFIKNLYGRRVTAGDSLVNHFLQSTGADASLLAFSGLKRELDNAGVRFKPLYIIHDAILLDLDRDALSVLREVTRTGLDVPKLKQKFPIKIESIGGEKYEQS